MTAREKIETLRRRVVATVNDLAFPRAGPKGLRDDLTALLDVAEAAVEAHNILAHRDPHPCLAGCECMACRLGAALARLGEGE